MDKNALLLLMLSALFASRQLRGDSLSTQLQNVYAMIAFVAMETKI